MRMLTSEEIMEKREKEPRCVALDAALNLDVLKATLCTATGATQCVELKKLTLGGFHRIFTARMNTGKEVIVRVAFENKIWEGSGKMESEIATIQWLKRSTDLPVPKILFACTESENSVGAPYMIMEKIPGKPLGKVWNTMSEIQKDQIVAKLAQCVVKVIKSTRFDQIGSIYSDGDTFRIGPIIPAFNPGVFRKDLDLDRGPWSSEREYLLACARREIAWITANEDELASEWSTSDPCLGKEELVKRYTTLFRKLEDKVASMNGLDVQFEGYGPFVLRHMDLDPLNIMVEEDDPTVITGIIDWEGSNTAPLWAVAQVPDFLVDYGDEYESDPADRASRARLREVFLEAASDALPGVFAAARQAAKGLKLARLEQCVQFVSTVVDLETAEEIASSLLDNS